MKDMARESRYLPVAAAVIATACLLAFVLRMTEARPIAPLPVGPQTSWTMYQSEPGHNAVFEQAGFRANWLTRLGDRINGGLAVVNGTVYADSFDKKLYALDAATGAIRWTAQADNIIMSTPVVHDGVVIVGSGHDGFLKPDDAASQIWGRPEGDDVYAFSTHDGSLLWKMHTQGQNMPSPAIAGGDTAIFANGDLHGYAVDLKTGAKRWTVDLQGVATMASAAVHDGKVFFSTCRNAPYVCETRAIDVRTGKTLWTNPYGGSDCSPTVADGLVFTNANKDDTVRYHIGGTNVIVAIDEKTGRTVWKHESIPGPYTFIASAERQIAGTVNRGVLYQAIGNAQRVIAFDDRTGQVLWTFHTSANVKMSPVVKNDIVYFGDTGGIFYRVHRRTGALIHASSYLQPFSTSPPVIIGDTIFVADGQMVLATPISDV